MGLSAALVLLGWGGGAWQYAAPTSDVMVGGWTPSSGTALYAMVDETTADDSDYIRSGAAPDDDEARMAVEAVTAPGPGTVSVLIRGRWVT